MNFKITDWVQVYWTDKYRRVPWYQGVVTYIKPRVRFLDDTLVDHPASGQHLEIWTDWSLYTEDFGGVYLLDERCHGRSATSCMCEVTAAPDPLPVWTVRRIRLGIKQMKNDQRTKELFASSPPGTMFLNAGVKFPAEEVRRLIGL